MEVEMSSYTLYFLSFVTLLLILVSLVSRKSTRISSSNNLRRPPGPWGLPFVGSLHHLITSQPQLALWNLAKKHGPVMHLRLGQVDTVVISSPAAAQEVLRDKDISFASRPSLLATYIMCYGNIDVAFAPYGAYWRALRKLCMLELLSSRKVRQFAPVRDSETMSLVKEIRATSRGGQPVNLGRLLVLCTSAITGKATFGERCDSDLRDRFMSAMEVVQANGSGFCVGDLFPSLGFVDVASGMRRRLQRAHQQVDTVVDKIIADAEVRREEKKTTTAGDDLLSVMLRVRDEGDIGFPIGNTNIKAIIVDLFTAGTETTSSTAEWVMTELIKNPKMMMKAQAEVRQMLDNKSPQDHENHMEGLHYTRMVIKETMRLHPALPLLLPRVCRETCDVGGFEVTEGTRVFINVWAVGRSPENWHEAEEFMPERFQDSEVDYDKGTHYEYLPFGGGRRKCPGDVFATAALELIVARLLYYFDWSLPNGMQPDQLDMDVTVGATARRTNHLHLVASPYKIPMEN
ncbi:9-beta-pimara-7,15-diene oxidase-like [Lolium rigidum]|uniref:9-beta-pimara-7,15-diene oxidase-like n=1 Tax=Lolium rigidum TaxID=89674 RepID=UPI001F5D1A6E|nr:9-beta-pimara-7,15-diene oxidase-like [Lolium rigidum]